MKPICSFHVAIAKGDIEGIGIVHMRDHTRLVLHDKDYLAPILHVVLSETERWQLIHALRECHPLSALPRRPFRSGWVRSNKAQESGT